MAARRRSPVTGIVVALLVVGLAALGLFLGDRYAEARVERESASRLQAELGTPAAPSVDVQGWPFLTQLVGRRLPRVHVVADDLGTGGASTVPVAHADLVLTDVTTPDWWQTLRAAHIEGTARLSYEALAAAAGVPLAPVGGGRLQVTRKTIFLGAEVVARVAGTPRLDVAAQTITLADPEIRIGGVRLPDVTADALLRTLLPPMPVTGLPPGLTATSLTAAADAVQVGLVGEDVELRR